MAAGTGSVSRTTSSNCASAWSASSRRSGAGYSYLEDVILPRLQRFLRAAMGWKDYHQEQFLVGEVRFGEPDDEYPPAPIPYGAVTLNQIAPRTGASCLYEYDVADSWEHHIEVEAELPLESVRAPLRCCAGGERACPPEDSGGPPGYERLLRALGDPDDDGDPDDEEDDQLRQWAGPGFDPEAFDLEAVNRRLARYRPRHRAARRPPASRR